jgi:two-component system cell cycle response regulator CtrA
MHMGILLIEDDGSTSDILKLALEAAGFKVDIARSAEDGFELTSQRPYDLIILDLSLPDMLGIDLLRDLRRTHHTPVLILSSLVELDAKLSSLTAGADDYMTKPFNMKELLARAHAVIRRAVRSDGPAMVAGRLRLSLSKMILEIDDEPVRVTPTEFSILEHLLRSKDRIVSKDSLAAYVYGNSKQRDPRIIEVFVSKLRQKLAASAAGQPFIETVWGEGYILRTNCCEMVPQPA